MAAPAGCLPSSQAVSMRGIELYASLPGCINVNAVKGALVPKDSLKSILKKKMVVAEVRIERFVYKSTS